MRLVVFCGGKSTDGVLVMKTSALEAQQPNNRAYKLMLQKAKDSIRKMSKSQIWA